LQVLKCFAIHHLSNLEGPDVVRNTGMLKCLPPSIKDHVRAKKFDKSFKMLFVRGRRGKKEGAIQKALECFLSTSDEKKEQDGFVEGMSQLADASLSPADVSAIIEKKMSSVSFTTECFGPRFIEQVKEPEAQFSGEMVDWKKCIELHSGPSADPMSSLEEATEIMTKCFPSPSKGIQRDFLYRSMYPTQIERCIKAGVPRSKIFIIDTLRYKVSLLQLGQPKECTA